MRVTGGNRLRLVLSRSTVSSALTNSYNISKLDKSEGLSIPEWEDCLAVIIDAEDCGITVRVFSHFHVLRMSDNPYLHPQAFESAFLTRSSIGVSKDSPLNILLFR